MRPRYSIALCALVVVLAVPACAQRGRGRGRGGGGGGGRGRQGDGFSVDGAISALALAPDDSVLAGATSTGIELWDPKGKVQGTLLVQGGEISTLAFNRDGRRIAGGDDTGELTVWNTSPGNTVWSVATHHQPIVDLRYSPDDSKLVSASGDGAANVWDAATGRPICTLGMSPPLPAALPVVANAAIIAPPVQDATPSPVATGSAPAAPILRGAAFSANGKQVITVTVLADATAPIEIRTWDAATGAMKTDLKPPNLDPRFSVISQDGQYVLVKEKGSGKAPYLIAPDTGIAASKPAQLSDDNTPTWDNDEGNRAAVPRFSLSEHNTQLLACYGSTVSVYEIATMKQLASQQQQVRRRRRRNPEVEDDRPTTSEALTGAVVDDVHNVVVMAMSITTSPAANARPAALKEPRGRVQILHYTTPEQQAAEAAAAAAATAAEQ